MKIFSKISINENYIFFILFLYLIAAINSVPYLYNLIPINLKDLIRIILGYSPFVISILCSFYLYINKKNFEFKKINIFLLIYILCIFLQLPALIISDQIIFAHGIYWIIATVSLPIFLLAISTLQNNIIISLFNITLFIFFVITMFFIFRLFYNLFLSPIVSFNFYGLESLDPSKRFLDAPVPRSSGMSRFSLIFFIVFHQLSKYTKKNNSFFKKFSFVFSIFFLFCVIHFQSRLSIGFVIIYGIFNIIPFLHQDSFKELFKKIFILYFFALLLNISFPLIQAKIKFDYIGVEKINYLIHPKLVPIIDYIIVKKKIEKENQSELKEESEFNSNDEKKIYEANTLSALTNTLSALTITLSALDESVLGRLSEDINNSGRLDLWKKSLNIFKTSPIIGKGPFADRIYIGENVSNMYFYSLLSGGILSFFVLLSLNIYIFAKCFQEVILNLEFKNNGNIYKKISLYFLGYFIFRSISENSYIIFSIDYFLVLLSSYFLINNQK